MAKDTSWGIALHRLRGRKEFGGERELRAVTGEKQAYVLEAGMGSSDFSPSAHQRLSSRGVRGSNLHFYQAAHLAAVTGEIGGLLQLLAGPYNF